MSEICGLCNRPEDPRTMRHRVVRYINNAPCCLECYREMNMEKTLSDAGVPPVFLKARMDEDHPYTPAIPDDCSLFLTGKVGTGKSHMAVALMTEFIKRTPISKAPHCMFITMADLLAAIKATFGQNGAEEKLITHFRNIAYLVIDDIGVELGTDWSLVQVYRIIDYRWSHDMLTIFTSNFDYAMLAEKLDTRIVSRINGMCKLIELTGKDLRSVEA